MFHLTLSNRFEFLLENLIERLKAEELDVFAAQQVIVPSTALRRRVELRCADGLGICANIEFSYLAQWLWARIGQVVDIQEQSPFTPALLSWRVYEIFGDPSFTRHHGRLARYLEAADPVMVLELAQRSAQLIEHYITYRPEWLVHWSEGRSVVGALQGLPADLASDKREDEIWQMALWRRITAELGTSRQHPSVAFFREVARLGADGALRVGLPATAHVFCLPTLPPLYLDILRQLSQWIDIRIYALNPCREHWFEIVDPKRLSYLATRHGTRQTYHEVGNTLLATWGRQSQAHLDLLFSDEGRLVEQGSLFVESADPAQPSLLGQIQDAILDMTELEAASICLDEDDRSLEIHVCHSLTRELEVLQDRLLALFAGPHPPLPQDVLVVTPDLENAAPLIDTVFGSVPVQRRIPYTITGRGQTRINPVARLLDSLLRLAGGRFNASAVFELMQQAPLAQAFQLDETALERIHQWLQQSGIRWGMDGAQRAALGLPMDERHSFADGLNRLFLAYALGDGAGATMINGRLPAGNPEGGDAQILGRFWRLVQQLDQLRQEWGRPMDAAAWHRSINDALSRFVGNALDWVDDLRAVQAAVSRLQQNMELGGAQSALPLDLLRAALADLLNDPARGGVPTGAVTFSSMSSLRNLPYRVICLVGLDDGAFPGNQQPAEFDLMALAPRRGDRQRRADERNLFLDLVLAAREILHISYCGRSIRDNSSQPPSVLVAELLEYAQTAIAEDAQAPQAMAAARQRLVVEHPLQAFAQTYFEVDGDARLRSFNTDYCDALRQRLAKASPPADLADDTAADDDAANEPEGLFFPGPLAPPPPQGRQVSLDQLERFFRNPSRMLLRSRFDIALNDAQPLLEDDEAFLPDYPGRQALAQRLLPHILADDLDAADLTAIALAGNDYPPGMLGDQLVAQELTVLREFAAQVAPAMAPALLPPVHRVFDFQLDGESWQLAGALADLRPEGLVRWRYDETRPADYLSAWIAHLFLCACAPDGVAGQTRWYSRDGSFTLQTCAQAQATLGQLLALYRQGLVTPLHFFPKAAWAYASNQENLNKAQARWHNSRNPAWGESADPAYELALRGVANPLDDQFQTLASAIFDPLLAHLDDPRL